MNGLAADAVTGERENVVQNRLKLNGLKTRRTRTREIQKVRQQTIQAFAFTPDDLQALRALRIEILGPGENGGSAGDARQRVPNFMGQDLQRVARARIGVRPLHALEVCLDLFVNTAELLRDLLVMVTQPAFAPGCHRGQACQK